MARNNQLYSNSYSSIVNDLPGLFCRFQPQGIIEFVNEAYAKTFGKTPEELIGQTFLSFIPKENREQVMARLNALTPESPVITHDHPVIISSGETRWHRWTNRLLTDENGRTIAYQSFGLDITEDVQAQQQLKENEKLLRTIAENFPRSFLSVINPDLTIGFTSGEEFKMSQLEPNQFVGLTVQDVFAPYGPETLNIIITAYRKALAGEPQYFELHINDQVQAYETVPLTNESGEIEKILAVVKNITERKQTESALRQSEIRYRAIVDDLVELLTRFKADGTIYFVNEAYEAIFGREGQSLVGSNLFEHLGERVGSIILKKIQRLTPENPVEVDEHEEILPDGRHVWLRWIDRGIFDENGRLVEVQSVGHDITNRRMAEDLLRQSENQLNHIIETVPEGVILLGPDNAIMRTNAIAETYLNILAPDWKNGPLDQLGNRPFKEFLQPPPKGQWHEITIDQAVYEIIAKPVENEILNAGWVIVLYDATEKKEIQQRIRQQERLAAVGQLAAGIAHDFNNVLSVIILYVENILRNSRLPNKTELYLQTIQQQAEHAAELVQQVLDFSRQSVLARRLVDLRPFINEMIRLFEYTLPEHIKIEFQAKDGQYLIQADPSRIQQMLMNLAVNARDAMADGGILRITLDKQKTDITKPIPTQELPPGQWVTIEITDTGTGIPPDVIDHIFEPFFTTKETGQGTGLGLAQVYGIIQQHQGYIFVSTKVGVGTTFTIFMPLFAAEKDRINLEDGASLQYIR